MKFLHGQIFSQCLDKETNKSIKTHSDPALVEIKFTFGELLIRRWMWPKVSPEMSPLI